MRAADVIVYLRTMERAIIAALAEERVAAGVRDGLTGVWVEDRKIASIGVHISRGVTTHGFAVNVDNDLEPFAWVVPCGISGVRMTSVGCETDRTRALPCFRKRMAHQFALAHARRQRLVSLARLESLIAPALAGHPA
jgi:lipoate-protein ligase B